MERKKPVYLAMLDSSSLGRGAFLLLMCFPFVPHHHAIIEFSVTTMCVPLGFSPISVAFSLAFVLLLGRWARPLPRFASLLPYAAIALLSACDFVYAAWRQGSPMLFPRAAVETVDVAAQTALLTAVVLFARQSVPIGNRPAPEQLGTVAVIAPFAISALLPRFLSLLCFTLSRHIVGQVGVCVLSGAIGAFLLRLYRKKDSGLNEPAPIQIPAILGLLFSSTFDELSLAALLSVHLNIDSQSAAALKDAAVGYAAGLAAYVLIVALVTLLLWRCSQRQLTGDVTPKPIAPNPVPNLESLSPRQRQVLLMAFEGLSDIEIAQRLELTPGTVGNHKRRALERLGASEIGELAETHDHPFEAEKPSMIRIVGGLLSSAAIVVLCASTLTSPDPDVAYCLAMMLGLALATASVVSLVSRPQETAEHQESAKRRGLNLLACAFWFILACSTALCWAFASNATTLTIGAMLFLTMLGKDAAQRASLHGQAEDAKAVGRRPGLWAAVKAPLPLVLISIEAGLVLAAHASRILGLLPSEASRYHLVARLLLGVAAAATLLASMGSDRIDETARENDVVSAQTVFFRSKGLSPLEAQVATLSAQGYTRPQICEMLHIAAGTVNSCRAAAYRKLGVHSKEELTELLDKSTAQQRR